MLYAMELVEGETLEARVKRSGPLPVSQALEAIEQAARALVAAEKCGVVHRDIKPSNIMLEADPSGALFVKIIDYGVAVSRRKPTWTEQTQIGFIGTPAFASPEQFSEAVEGGQYAFNIYLLGADVLVSPHRAYADFRQDAVKRFEQVTTDCRLNSSRLPVRSGGNHRITKADAGAGFRETATVRPGRYSNRFIAPTCALNRERRHALRAMGMVGSGRCRASSSRPFPLGSIFMCRPGRWPKRNVDRGKACSVTKPTIRPILTSPDGIQDEILTRLSKSRT